MGLGEREGEPTHVVAIAIHHRHHHAFYSGNISVAILAQVRLKQCFLSFSYYSPSGGLIANGNFAIESSSFLSRYHMHRPKGSDLLVAHWHFVREVVVSAAN